MGYILQSGEDYYWGDLMIDHICKITKPTTLPGILHTLATEGDKALKKRRLKLVEDVWENEDIEEAADRWKLPEGEDLFKPIG